MLRTLPSTSPSPVAECAQLRGANHSSLGFTRQPAIARAVWGTCRGSKGRRAVGASRSERGGKRRRSCRGKMKRSFSKARVRTIPSELVPACPVSFWGGLTPANHNCSTFLRRRCPPKLTTVASPSTPRHFTSLSHSRSLSLTISFPAGGTSPSSPALHARRRPASHQPPTHRPADLRKP